MLKGINSLLNAHVLYALRAMGHGDDLIIAGANFPAKSIATKTVLGKVIKIDASASEVIKAILSVYPIDTYSKDSIARMEVDGEPNTILPVMNEGQSEITAVVGPKKMSAMLRLEFYERAKKAYAVIQTSERRFYSGFAIRKGVIGPNI